MTAQSIARHGGCDLFYRRGLVSTQSKLYTGGNPMCDVVSNSGLHENGGRPLLVVGPLIVSVVKFSAIATSQIYTERQTHT